MRAIVDLKDTQSSVISSLFMQSTYMRMRSQQFIEMDKTKLHGQNMNVLWGVTCLDILPWEPVVVGLEMYVC